MGRFTYQGAQFYMDGEPFRILSGALHYFRVVPEYWEDRLKKLKACGLNTIETCVAWNLHEPKEGEFCFTGIADLEGFLQSAEKLGLYVILRPGPYICTEWEFGGLPSWLLSYKGIHLRCKDKVFLEKTRHYFETVFPIIRPHLLENGGTVIAMQIENEYGSYGDDKEYLQELANMYQELKMNCMLFTSDGPGNFMLRAGILPEYLAAVNFGSNPKGNFPCLENFQPARPLFCCEYWNGWFDHWYEEHHKREPKDAAEVYKEMLEMGASVNLYMFHGGTNFGFYNGANCGEVYQPTVTSYDYDSLLNECGDMTEKYYLIQEINKEMFGLPQMEDVCDLPKKAYGEIVFTQSTKLFQNLERICASEPHKSSYPLTMEELGQDYGYLIYDTQLEGPFEEMDLVIEGLHDRAYIYIEEELKGVRDRMNRQNDEVRIGLEKGEKKKLRILVENLGRVNYGSNLADEKGILKGVRIGPVYHYGYTMYPIDCRNLERLKWEELNEKIKEPVFLKGELQIEQETELADTFVRLDGFHKGNVWINGFHLGRYWNDAGPQKTLYLPAPLLKKGKNTIMVLELEGYEKAKVNLVEEPDLG